MKLNSIEDIQEYGISSTVKEIPDDDNYRGGVIPGYTAPAKWWNWLFGAVTKRLNEVYTTVTSMYNEILNAVGGTAVVGNDHQLKDVLDNFVRSDVLITTVVNTLYKVGDIKITINNVNPKTYLTGTDWEAVGAGRVVQCADNSHAGGTTVEAGIPNITTQDNDGSNTSGYMLWSMGNTYANNNIKAGTTYGAVSTMAGATPYGVHAGNIDFPYRLNFNAKNGETKTDGTLKTANEHHVYGNSDTVQPPAYFVYMWKRIS